MSFYKIIGFTKRIYYFLENHRFNQENLTFLYNNMFLLSKFIILYKIMFKLKAQVSVLCYRKTRLPRPTDSLTSMLPRSLHERGASRQRGRGGPGLRQLR